MSLFSHQIFHRRDRHRFLSTRCALCNATKKSWCNTSIIWIILIAVVPYSSIMVKILNMKCIQNVLVRLSFGKTWRSFGIFPYRRMRCLQWICWSVGSDTGFTLQSGPNVKVQKRSMWSSAWSSKWFLVSRGNGARILSMHNSLQSSGTKIKGFFQVPDVGFPNHCT